ncbi:MAG: tryptophanyl-tRNA synthetase, tryptophanyl-tRNA synthetase, partial [Candidatus Krumholzibacteriota bacterium]|nr:tryptophanyl-tRNA synthetase, tryptophanyl-tRNA synthetase [Candidatus Krumholzibacteriota bacterium]
RNLITILGAIDPAAAAKFESDAKAGNIRYGDLKTVLAEKLVEYLAPFREKKRDLASRPDEVWDILRHGSDAARKIASATLLDAKKRMGFV